MAVDEKGEGNYKIPVDIPLSIVAGELVPLLPPEDVAGDPELLEPEHAADVGRVTSFALQS
jgi:hypothetical protein